MAFKMTSQSAVKKSGFKMMGSSPLLDKDPHTGENPKHVHPERKTQDPPKDPVNRTPPQKETVKESKNSSTKKEGSGTKNETSSTTQKVLKTVSKAAVEGLKHISGYSTVKSLLSLANPSDPNRRS